MTRVCQKWFPETDGFFMDDALKSNIDIYLKNFDDDWSFSIIISGAGKVRVGKSVLAMQIGCYVAYTMKEKGYNPLFDLEKNFVFRGEDLIKKGEFLGINHKYSPVIFDEAGSELQAKKILSAETQQVLDYLREAGQYNLFNIFVLPDFFDLPKGIAVNFTDMLLDVYVHIDENEKFQRGFFKLFSERSKKSLYIVGKPFLNYTAQKSDFVGNYRNFYPIDKDLYRDLKHKALSERGKNKVDKFDIKINQRNAALYILHKVCGYTQKDIGNMIEKITHQPLPQSTFSEAINWVDHGSVTLPIKPEFRMPLPPINNKK